MNLIVRQFFVFFLLFAILERAEVSVISLINSDKQLSKSILLEEAEDTSGKGSENKEQGLKDYWNCTFSYNHNLLQCDYAEKLHIRNDQISRIQFYPPVPTPPPDIV